MVRPYGIKVNKRKERQERYDKEEDEEEEHQPKSEQKQKAKESVKKAKRESTLKAEEEDNEEEKEITEEAADHVDVGIPINLSDNNNKEKPGVVFVLEKASLEVAKVGKTYQLLNSEDHANFLKKNKRNPADYRPDITHQALLMILDSPVNKAGRLKAIYVRTEKGVLFEVNPHTRLPRVYKRFAGVMLQLLQKLSISAAGRSGKLLRVIKNPVEDHLPVNSRKIGFSYSSDKLVNMQKHLATVCNDTDTVFVLGAMAHGKIDCDYIEDFVAISGYPLSAAYCVSRICEALSTNWNII